MTTPRSTAKKLCTNVEYRLVNESFPPLVSELSDKQLAQRIKRARVARDKYRSLAERQKREAKGQIAPRGARAAAGNKNTVIKQKIFDETLTRYERKAGPVAQAEEGNAKPARKSAKTSGATLAAKQYGNTPRIPPISKILKRVAKAVKEKESDRSQKTVDSKSTDGSAANFDAQVSRRPRKGSGNREAIEGPNAKGPEFPRNAHERGRLSAAFKRQQARKDNK